MNVGAWKRGLGAVGTVALLVVAGFAVAANSEVVTLQVAPSTLQIGVVQSGSVTAHVGIPYSVVDPATVTLNGVPASVCFADDRGELVGKFPEGAIKAIVAPPSAVMVLEGVTKSGVPFSGSCTVRVAVFNGK
mgnify:CR=1 FL=1